MDMLYLIVMALTWVLIAVTVCHVVMDNRQPAKTMAWALIILFLPLVGIVLYLVFGINHRRQRLISQGSLDQLSKRSMLNYTEQQDNLHIPERHRQMVELFINQNLSLPFRVESTDIMTDGYTFFPELLADIAKARHHIHIAMYIIEDDALGNLVADTLIDKVRQGVTVRIVYDDVGCWKVSRRFFEHLREEGIEVLPFLPVHFPTFTSKINYRNHRKIIVIDGQVGYVGGMNVARRYVSRKWRDTMLRLQGTIVYSLQRAFLVDWYFVDRTLITHRDYYPPSAVKHQSSAPLAQIVTSSPANAYPEIMQGFVRAITTAQHYIYLETPYFLPNEPVLFALKTAVMAGVDVRILCPLNSDARFTEWASRSYLRELQETGAQVYLYEPGFMHSKLMVIDDSLSTCGSTNCDFRSFENNFESNIFIYDHGTALRLKKVFLDDQSLSVPLDNVPSWQHPTFLRRLWESVTRLLAPLL